MLLRIDNLSVWYGNAEALADVSISVGEGLIVALIGANGAGKTTLLRAISGLKAPTSGEIWYQQARIDGMAAHRISALGIMHVPEGRRVLAPLTVMENLQMGAYRRKNKREVEGDLRKIFDSFPILKERSEQAAGSLSGGEQQMLAIARALMARPKLLLLDEPTMGISPIVVGEIQRIIRNINLEGVSILLVEQNVHIAFGLANKVYVLEVGKVTLEGNADEIAGKDYVKKAYLGG